MKRNLANTVSIVFAFCFATNSVFAASPLKIPKSWRGSFSDDACQAALKAHQSVMVDLKVVYDNDGLWDWGEPKAEGPELLTKMVDQYADAGARFIVWGCGNHKAWSYTPKAQERWGAKMSRKTRREFPIWSKLEALLASYLDAGTDPLAIVLKQAKVRKLSVLAGFRDVNRYDKHFPNSWFLANPQFHLSPERNPWYPTEMGVNFAVPEVRQQKVREWIDVVERYDVDGLHLEFLRSLPFFEKDESNKIQHMNTLLRMLRRKLDRIGRTRDKGLMLSIWLPTPCHMRILRPMFPPDFFDMAAQGLDPEAWIQEGLVDILMPSIYATDLEMPKPADMPSWVKTAKGSSTRVYACVMNITRDTSSGKTYSMTATRTTEVMRSLSSQYDGLFLFNSEPYSLAGVLEVAAAASDQKRGKNYPATQTEEDDER